MEGALTVPWGGGCRCSTKGRVPSQAEPAEVAHCTPSHFSDSISFILTPELTIFYMVNGICYRLLLYSHSTWYALLLCTIVGTVEQTFLHFGLFIAQCASLDISARYCDRSQVVNRLQYIIAYLLETLC